MKWKELLVKIFFVGGPPNILSENSFLNASSYYQLFSWTYFKIFKFQILSGTTENSGFRDICWT